MQFQAVGEMPLFDGVNKRDHKICTKSRPRQNSDHQNSDYISLPGDLLTDWTSY